VITLVAVACILPAADLVRRLAIRGYQGMKSKKTVAERVSEFGPTVRARLKEHFRQVGVAYPPAKMLLIGLKQERQLEVWVAGKDGHLKMLKSYPIQAASGHIGPKLKEGDRQVPEGFYAVESLNPNSLFHLALRVNYPNEQDRAWAKAEGRTGLGGDIMIHGSNVSIGCLAMGNEAAEDLFVLAAETGVQNVKVILSPVDFRVRGLPETPAGGPKRKAGSDSSLPVWTGELYARIKTELKAMGRGAAKEAPAD